MSSNVEKSRSKANLAKFIIPSIIGIILFMVPIKYDGQFTIPIKVVSDYISSLINSVLPQMCVIIISISAIGSIIATIFKPKFMMNNQMLKDLFYLKPVWLIVRVIGMVLAIMVVSGIGPEHILSGATGTFILNDLLTVLVIIFVFAGLLLPLLLDFGLLEYIGTLLVKIMRPIFKLPGRSAVDCITSWLGDGTLGVMLTAKQYKDGYYSKREAAVIATTFSAVSITFCLVVIETVNMTNMFVPFYLSICVIGFVIAVIVPRIPPLSLKKDEYYNDAEKPDESIPSGHSTFSWALEKALIKSSSSKGTKQFIINGSKNALDMWLGVLPTVMAIGTIILVIAEYTPVFSILGKPFIPLLELLKLPEPDIASTCMLVGFGDMLTPAIIGSRITSELTRFVIAVVSVTQLIYMSEVGSLIISSKLPVKLWELFIIFIERTIISLVIATMIGRFILHLI
ncbi:YjiH family protein [Sedimentibacter sp. zth1]|uniref:YjiH family protein n=1 Tax=Sedimentibacter sp. zth1 TaxID=2816908 RepID=UPI001A925BBC|nr:YjiH family protein [Sedimentibacter sp. zth1]QSX06950.1 YjiH family protein [Sedimentibacter sp. zth1]